MPVILAIKAVEIRTEVQGQFRQKVCETSSQPVAGMVVLAYYPSYGRKHKIGESQPVKPSRK
jgi:hypothetical protein